MNPGIHILTPGRRSIDALFEFWHQLCVRGKCTILLNIFLPVCQQAASILSFYLIMRLILAAITESPEPAVKFKYGLFILGMIAVTSFITWLNGILEARQKRHFLQITRKYLAEKYETIRRSPKEERQELLNELDKNEHDYIGPLVNSLNSTVQMASSFVIVAFLILVLGIASFWMSAVIATCAILVFLIIRWSKGTPYRPDPSSRKESTEKVRDASKEIVFADEFSDKLLENYVENDLDRINLEAEGKRIRTQKYEQILVAIFSAVILIAAMNLVKLETFSHYPAAAIIAFILVIRVCLQHIQQMTRHWSIIYRERVLIYEVGTCLGSLRNAKNPQRT